MVFDIKIYLKSRENKFEPIHTKRIEFIFPPPESKKKIGSSRHKTLILLASRCIKSI